MAISTCSSHKSCDVFLSFSSADTGGNFTSHLYDALCQKCIITFRDDKLVRGKEISQTRLKAIEASKISVVIFSENYAQSKRCLEGLVKIMECKDTMGQEVLPIFYQVDPSDVSKQTGNFGEAFKQVTSNSDRVLKWITALTQAAKLAGWVSNNYGLDADLCKEVAVHIMKKLYSCCPSSAGLDRLDSQ